MRSDRLALLVVAALAVTALAAGAATVEQVQPRPSTPVADDGPTPTPVDPGGEQPAARPVPASTAAAACPNCPSTDWPGLLALLGDVPGGPLAAVVAVLALAGALSWAALRRERPTGGAGDDPATDRSATVPERSPVAVPAADPPPADDEVLRAWRDLRERVAARAGVDVAPLTPREVAATARENGFAADAAGELTALFRRVRYGDRPPSEDRERRAADARERLGPVENGAPGAADGSSGDERVADDAAPADGDERVADGGERR